MGPDLLRGAGDLATLSASRGEVKIYNPSGKSHGRGVARACDRFYEDTLARHGPGTARGVRWPSAEVQRGLFRELAACGAWQGASVADVGCGVGDLLGFLQEENLSVDYWGCDISPAMVRAARRKHPDRRARFERRDVLARGFPRRFDYVVASGTFNIRVTDHEAWMERMLTAMFRACRRAVAFNVLLPRPDEVDGAYLEYLGYYFLADLDRVQAFAHGLAARVETLVPGPADHATLFLHRDTA